MGLFGPGLGRKRSRFGKWLDRNGISQTELSEASGVSKSTISRLSQDDIVPNLQTERKITKAIRRNWDSEFSSEDFW